MKEIDEMNSVLASIVPKAKEVSTFGSSMPGRGKGATFRCVMWGLLRASANPDSTVLMVCKTRPEAVRAYEMARNAVASLAGAVLSGSMLSVTLPNASVFMVKWIGCEIRGTTFDYVAKDY